MARFHRFILVSIFFLHPAPLLADQSPWHVTATSSQLDGSGTYVATLVSENTIPNMIGESDHAFLTIRCKGGDLETFVTWPLYMGDGDDFLKWKFDDGQVWQQTWTGSKDGTASFNPTPRDFLDDLSKSKRLVMDAYPYQRDSIEAVFDIGDTAQIVSAATHDCPS